MKAIIRKSRVPIIVAVVVSAATWWITLRYLAPTPTPAVQVISAPNSTPGGPARQRLFPTRAVPENAPATVTLDPGACLARLLGLNFTNAAERTASFRIAIQQLENLVECGPRAVPVIGEYLRQNLDIPWGARGEGLVPSSLRIGLFEVLRRIGGPEAEQTLAAVLATSGAGNELRLVARLLEEMAPGKYRDAIVSAARELAAQASTVAGEAGRRQREAAYDLLGRAGDRTLVATAQAELITGNGRIDEAAFRYLNRTLGNESLALVQQTLADPRLKDLDSQERLVEAVAERARDNPEAHAALQQIASNPALSRRARDEAFDALTRAGDTSLANVARERVVTEEGYVNESALRYLARASGDEALSIVQQVWGDPRVRNNEEREELVQVIVGRVGQNGDADRMWQDIVGNPQMPANLRQEAIAELDDRGLNRRRPADQDRQLALARMRLLEQLAPQLDDPQLAARAKRVYQELSQVVNAPPPRPNPEPRR